MYYNQELGLCIEFGPVRVDSVRRGGGPPPPWIKSPLRRFTPSWTSTRVTCDCLLPFVHPLLSQVDFNGGHHAAEPFCISFLGMGRPSPRILLQADVADLCEAEAQQKLGWVGLRFGKELVLRFGALWQHPQGRVGRELICASLEFRVP